MSTHQSVTLPYETPRDRQEAAEFVADLVRQSVTFQSRIDRAAGVMRVEFTGGF